MAQKTVITGVSAITSCGVGFEALATNLPLGGTATKAKTFEMYELAPERTAFLVEADFPAILGKKGLRTLDKATKMLLSAIELEWKDEIAATPRDDRPGTLVATAFGSVESIGNFITDSIRHGVSAVNPNLFGNTVINSPGGNANIRFDLPHLSATMSSGFDSGLEGVIYTCDHIANGYGDTILTAGLEEASIYQFIGADREEYLSPSDTMRPFNTTADGFVLGEGVAVLLMESEEHAKNRGARALASIKGYASGFDVDKKGEIAAMIIQAALDNAGLTAQEIDFIVSDANGLVALDEARLNAIKATCPSTPVTCYKPVFGETWGAAGILDVAGVIADFSANRISPICGSAPTMSGLTFVTTLIEKKSKYALLTSLSPEGNCSAIIVENVN